MVHPDPDLASGYVITEKDKYKVCPEKADAIGDKSLLGKLQSGETHTLEDGTVLRPEDIYGKEKRLGRKVVILGDTSDPSGIAEIGIGPDLLVHEATYAAGLQHMAKKRGHSTARMAGEFARGIGAKTLAITHFSNRYKMNEASPEVSL